MSNVLPTYLIYVRPINNGANRTKLNSIHHVRPQRNPFCVKIVYLCPLIDIRFIELSSKDHIIYAINIYILVHQKLKAVNKILILKGTLLMDGTELYMIHN